MNYVFLDKTMVMVVKTMSLLMLLNYLTESFSSFQVDAMIVLPQSKKYYVK